MNLIAPFITIKVKLIFWLFMLLILLLFIHTLHVYPSYGI